MVSGNVPRLHAVAAAVVLAALGGVPVACSEKFKGCEAGSCDEPQAGDAGSDDGASGGQSSGRGGGSPGAGGAPDSDGGEPGMPGGANGSEAGSGGSNATGGSGGGDGTSGEGGAAGLPDEPDTRPPTILSVSPPDGARALRNDTLMVVTFSEPMNRVATQAAYQSPSIPASGVTFDWNSDSTELTITPNRPIPYAEGGLSVAALVHELRITDTAEDRAGNRLEQDYTWSFSTLRHITQRIAADWRDVAVVQQYSRAGFCIAANDPTRVGDTFWHIPTNLRTATFVSFDIGVLPVGIVSFEQVTLEGRQTNDYAYPFGSNSGFIRASSVSVDPPSAIDWDTPVLHELGVFSDRNSASTTDWLRTLDVTVALADDYANLLARASRSQFVLRADNPQEFEYVEYTCADFALTVSYLLP